MTISVSIKNSLTIALVPGSHSTPFIYDLVSQSLIAKGYATVGISLPSACSLNNQRWPPATLADDALQIQEDLQTLLNKGKDVILILCSYGGFPGTEALGGLSSRHSLQSSAAGQEQQGAIVGILYLSSFLPFPGDSQISIANQPLVESGTYVGLPGITGPDIFTEWRKEGDKRAVDIDHYFNQLITHSADSLNGIVTFNAWVPSGFQGKVEYLVGELDASIAPSLRRRMVQKVNASRTEKIAVTEIAGAGHLMVLERSEEVVAAIERMIISLIR